MKKEKQYNRHHKIPKSLWGTNWHPNVSKVEVWKHRARHYIFWNDWPASQLVDVLKDNDPVWNPVFKKAVLDILELFTWNYYVKEAHKWDKVYKRDIWVLYSYLSQQNDQ